jgi:hypothetical protein
MAAISACPVRSSELTGALLSFDTLSEHTGPSFPPYTASLRNPGTASRSTR